MLLDAGDDRNARDVDDNTPAHIAAEGEDADQLRMLASETWQFKVDRPQTTVVAKNLSVLQMFISRMPKICAILQLVSAPLNPIPIAEHFRRSHPQCEHSCGQHIYMRRKTMQSKMKTLFNELNTHVNQMNKQCTRTK